MTANITTGTRVADTGGITGTVVEGPWDTASGPTVKIELDARFAYITPSGTVNALTAFLRVVPADATRRCQCGRRVTAQGATRCWVHLYS